ncbi:MAG TPA: hypothetical protein IAC15_08480 [Candidatus Onthomonas avicola]|nr:hypothetical protein [Candidatus Onthomonas avicola]
MTRTRNRFRVWALSASPAVVPWLLLPAAFLAGGLAGHLLAGVSAGTLSQVLEQYAASCIRQDTAPPPELLPLLWRYLREPFLALLFGCSALGIVALPGLLAVQGFLTAYAASALIRTWGSWGLLAAGVWVGVGNFILLTVVLAIAVPGWGRAWEIAADCRLDRRLPRDYPRRCLLLGLAGLLAALVYEYVCWAWLTPFLWSSL